jgi:cell division septation protein DedD
LNRDREEVIEEMAKAAPKGKEIAAKTTQSKAGKSAAVKPAAAKATKPSGKTAEAAGKTAASAPKKAPVKGGNKKTKKANQGDRYSCEVCGLVVSVDETCGCVDACDIICCGKEMKAGK